jgi:hypothetical protein
MSLAPAYLSQIPSDRLQALLSQLEAHPNSDPLSLLSPAEQDLFSNYIKDQQIG